MAVPVVVLDACVLYPAAQRDLFMWLAATGVVQAHWTNTIHDEWIRNVARDFGVKRKDLEHIARLMNQHASDALISRYRQHEHWFVATDAKDRHVAAAAWVARQQSGAALVTVITWNLKDFDRQELAGHGLAAEDPDTFLCSLMTQSPQTVMDAFERMRANLRHPPKTSRECADTFLAQGLKRFAGLVNEFFSAPAVEK